MHPLLHPPLLPGVPLVQTSNPRSEAAAAAPAASWQLHPPMGALGHALTTTASGAQLPTWASGVAAAAGGVGGPGGSTTYLAPLGAAEDAVVAALGPPHNYTGFPPEPVPPAAGAGEEGPADGQLAAGSSQDMNQAAAAAAGSGADGAEADAAGAAGPAMELLAVTEVGSCQARVRRACIPGAAPAWVS
jgi:hypothetical protein